MLPVNMRGNFQSGRYPLWLRLKAEPTEEPTVTPSGRVRPGNCCQSSSAPLVARPPAKLPQFSGHDGLFDGPFNMDSNVERLVQHMVIQVPFHTHALLTQKKAPPIPFACTWSTAVELR